MDILLNKRDAILNDINAINERMRALEAEHAERIVQLHELRGAQRIVDILLQEAEQAREEAEKRAAALDKMAQSAQEEGVSLDELLDTVPTGYKEAEEFDVQA